MVVSHLSPPPVWGGLKRDGLILSGTETVLRTWLSVVTDIDRGTLRVMRSIFSLDLSLDLRRKREETKIVIKFTHGSIQFLYLTLEISIHQPLQHYS